VAFLVKALGVILGLSMTDVKAAKQVINKAEKSSS
jgi:hypothetical protein